jgi:hypothetical protein
VALTIFHVVFLDIPHIRSVLLSNVSGCMCVLQPNLFKKPFLSLIVFSTLQAIKAPCDFYQVVCIYFFLFRHLDGLWSAKTSPKYFCYKIIHCSRKVTWLLTWSFSAVTHHIIELVVSYFIYFWSSMTIIWYLTWPPHTWDQRPMTIES